MSDLQEEHNNEQSHNQEQTQGDTCYFEKKSEENIDKYLHLLFEIGALPLSDEHNEYIRNFKQKYSFLSSNVIRGLVRDIKYILLFIS